MEPQPRFFQGGICVLGIGLPRRAVSTGGRAHLQRAREQACAAHLFLRRQFQPENDLRRPATTRYSICRRGSFTWPPSPSKARHRRPLNSVMADARAAPAVCHQWTICDRQRSTAIALVLVVRASAATTRHLMRVPESRPWASTFDHHVT
jgi:hypothetical protein